MTHPPIDEHLRRSLESLKDFQRATVHVVYDNLFNKGQRRMLVADEVGLGKTVVAKGVIVRRIVDRLKDGNSTPLKVTYICSNQVIASENVGKLDPYPDQGSHDKFASRLTYLAFEPDSDQQGLLLLNTLTPETSFNKGRSTGQQGERRILYSLLMQDEHLAVFGKPISAILRAGVQKDASVWFEELEREREEPLGFPLRSCCPGRFLTAIRKRMLSKSLDCPLFEHLGTRRRISLYDAVVEFAKMVTLKNFRQYREGSNRLVRELKDTLAEVCVDYIDADIYILDEFQRFKELVDHQSTSEASDIARRIFGKAEARILLLSATPFKAYASDSAWESGEEHYKEFRTILRFLFDGDESALKEYENHRQALFKQLLELNQHSDNIDTSHRDAVQDVLRKVMCRTERLSVSENFNAMTKDKWQSQPLQVSAGDIQNFIATDNVVRHLNKSAPHGSQQLHAPVEFCKSAPFPLSFLDDYKLKHELRDRKDEPHIKQILKANPAAWISHDRVDKYQLRIDGEESAAANAKLCAVIKEVLDKNGANLLWIPPSLPCYPLSGAFSRSAGFSKTLVFSSWLMVPRMLSSLISYEVERRTVGDSNSVDGPEKDKRKYFHAKNEKRHPIPQLVFLAKKSETGDTPNNMSNFALLYPSQSLADAFDPKKSLREGKPLAQVRREVVEYCQTLIEQSNLQSFCNPSGESSRWYWAAPLLLDKYDLSIKNDVTEWLKRVNESEDSSFFFSPTRDHDGKRQDETWKIKHFQEFRMCFEKPSDAGLGPIPENLAEVLADIVFASPAVTALRCVRQQFVSDHYNRTLFAFDLASEFVSLFNKPESIAAVRLSTIRSKQPSNQDSSTTEESSTANGQTPYWRRVLQYCVDGCLQSVLDEFFHVLKSDCPTIKKLFERIVDSMNLGTASIRVDDLNGFLKDKRRPMRCHYAVDLGNQRIETDDGKDRIKGIRLNFNSPFRPFVLATTSIGQEGLDFHTYCRKIVHWNLPTNPIDLEQREGRINRFKGLVIRQQIASRYGGHLNEESLKNVGVWDALFDIAGKTERDGTGKCEMIPFWHVEADLYQIERIIPFYPFSRDRAKLSSLLKTLALYRLAFGQPRQAELVEHLLTNISESRIKEIRSKLMIDLSPINYGGCTHRPSTPVGNPEDNA